MEIGIIGLPNVGKSSFFNLITKSNAEVGNFPFTTINPNTAIVNVPDERLEILKKIFSPEKVTYPTLKFIDIAGLVKDAHKGAGLGNKFLSEIRTTDALVQVVRCFENPDVANVLDKVSPEDEIEIIKTELLLADIEILVRAREKISGKAKAGDAESKKKVELLDNLINALNSQQSIDEKFKDSLHEYPLITIKPIIYCLNTDDTGNYALVEKIKSKYGKKINNDAENIFSIPIKTELELLELPEEERDKFRKELNLGLPPISKLLKSLSVSLNLITFYTVVGYKEIRGWFLQKGSTALDAAGKIHTDMARGFIHAEVYSYDELIEYGSEQRIRECGVLRLVGKEYEMCDGDILRIVFKS
jgi:GTP-binding protein YchF